MHTSDSPAFSHSQDTDYTIKRILELLESTRVLELEVYIQRLNCFVNQRVNTETLADSFQKLTKKLHE